MDYLTKVLGISVTYESTDFTHYPNFIAARYQLQTVSLDGLKAVFVNPKTELDQIATLKKHIERIHKQELLPVVLILKEITYRQKEYLLREKIPFVVDGKQIYLPFMAVYLQERCNAEKHLYEEILPSAQVLFLYFIYRGAKELTTSEAAKDLSLTPTSISRASKQLEELGLLKAKRIGVQKILFTAHTPKESFQLAAGKLVNPVKRTIYIPQKLVDTTMLESGYSALAEYSMLNEPNIRCYATEKISQWNNVLTNTLIDLQNQVAIEMWRYDPRKLSKQGTVDVLSLALALKDDADERVEEAVEEMMNDLWGKIDG